MGVAKNLLLSQRADIAHLEDELTKAVRLRNLLVHRYFRERAAALVTEEGQNQMLDELRQAILFLSADGRAADPAHS
jgi:flagellar basal body-associated protein FliL